MKCTTWRKSKWRNEGATLEEIAGNEDAIGRGRRQQKWEEEEKEE